MPPDEAPLKDTVVVPAGGWVAIRIIADNPGWWVVHCHIDVHADDGMSFVLNEAPEEQALYTSHSLPLDYPSCESAFEHPKHATHSCNCFHDEDAVMHLTPFESYQCSTQSGCRHTEVREGLPVGVRAIIREGGRIWRILTAVATSLAICGAFVLSTIMKPRTAATATSDDADKAVPDNFILTWHSINYFTKDRSKLLVSNSCGIIKSGEMVAIMGASGAGKTQLINVIAGRNPNPAHGNVRLNGRDMSTCSSAERRAAISYVSQTDLFRNSLSVRMTLTIAAELKMSRNDVAEHVEERIESFGFSAIANNPVGSLSGGQKRRLSVACEMMTDPKLIVMDEPLSGLDAFTALSLLRWLRNICDERRIMVLMTVHMVNCEPISTQTRTVALADRHAKTHTCAFLTLPRLFEHAYSLPHVRCAHW